MDGHAVLAGAVLAHGVVILETEPNRIDELVVAPGAFGRRRVHVHLLAGGLRGGKGRQARDTKDRQTGQLEATNAQVTTKRVRKNEVSAELMEDNIRSKKPAGEL